MKTLLLFEQQAPQIPIATVWLLSDLAEFKGKQELFARQSPQKLERLREHALIESAVASNRIEGIEIERTRIGTVVFGNGGLRDRNEEEVRGYQDALSWIHEYHEETALTVETMLKLHHMARPGGWDSGLLKEKDGEIIEKQPDGRVSVRFRPLSARETPDALHGLCELWDSLLRNAEVPPLVLWAASNLDFLCIHPFRDGNGRVARLLLLLQLYRLGFHAGRFISLERIIEQSKDRYYDTLQISSQSWRDGNHDPWPYINYLLNILRMLYAEFAQRFDDARPVRGEKTETIRVAIKRFVVPFHISELQRDCPGVSLDLIRKALKDLRASGEVECIGRGKHARWRVMDTR